MAKHLEQFIEGEARYIIACDKRGCSWVAYEIVDEARANYLDDAHAIWHVDDQEAEAELTRRRDGRV